MPTINIDGLRVSYIDTGRGLPIVFLPGLTGSKEWFVYQFSGLSGSYRVLSYDIRQAGRQEYTIDLLAEDLARFLSALRIQSSVIGGHSFGAAIAEQFALAYPQRTKSLILISAFPHLPEESPATILKWLTPGEIEIQTPAKSFFSRLFGGRRVQKPEPDGLDYLAANTAGLTRATQNERLRIIREFDLRGRLQEMTMPALIVAGGRDNPAILEGCRLLYEEMADAILEVIEDSGHFCFYERHDLFNNMVDYFLTERMQSFA